MSFLKKIFGGKEARTYAPREPRVLMTDAHRLTFELMAPGGERPVSLFDVSTGGLSLVQSEAPELKVGDRIKGRLHIDERALEISCEVRHLSKGLVGCLLMQPGVDYRRAIESYLRVEILALKLIKVDEAYLKPDPAGQVVWFTDSSGSEVYCVHDAKGLVSFHVSFLTNYVEGGRGKKLLCGYIDEEKRKSLRGVSAALIRPLDAPSAEMLQLASVLVQNVEKLAPELKAELQTYLGLQAAA